MEYGPLTALEIRMAVDELRHQPLKRYPVTAYPIHPRHSYKLWWLDEKKAALRMWQMTFKWLTLKEWWADRPWR